MKFVHLMKTICVCRSNMMGFIRKFLHYDKEEARHSLAAWAWNNLLYGSLNSNISSSQTYFSCQNIDDNMLTCLHGEVSKVFETTKKICLLHEDDKMIILGLKLYFDWKLQRMVSFVTCKSNWRPLETMLFERLILWKKT